MCSMAQIGRQEILRAEGTLEIVFQGLSQVFKDLGGFEGALASPCPLDPPGPPLEPS